MPANSQPIAYPRSSPAERRSSALPAPSQALSSSSAILQSIAQIEAKCTGPTAGPSPSVPLTILQPLFDAVRACLARETPELAPIKEKLTSIERLVKRIDQKEATPQNNATYASVANRGIAGDTRTFPARNPSEPPKETARTSKEVLVKIQQPEEAANVKNFTNEALWARITQGADAPPALRGVIAVKKLPSGDVVLHASSEADKEALQQNTNWVTRVAPSAKVHKKTFTVLIHGVSTEAFKRSLGEKPARDLEKQNARLHPSMKVLHTSWITKKSEEKAFSSLIVEVDCATAANRMIIEGVIHGRELKITELYDRSYRITQCFNCYKYKGHHSKHCKEATVCGWCSGGHPTGTCPSKGDPEKKKCAACNGGRHEAWSRDCPVRRSEREKKLTAYRSRHTLYPTTHLTHKNPPPQIPIFTASAPSAFRGRTPDEESEGEWTAVDTGEKKRKIIKRGRPSNLSRPEAQASKQIDILFSQASSTVLLPNSQATSDMEDGRDNAELPSQQSC